LKGNGQKPVVQEIWNESQKIRRTQPKTWLGSLNVNWPHIFLPIYAAIYFFSPFAVLYKDAYIFSNEISIVFVFQRAQ
jgi:hypothetical protein